MSGPVLEARALSAGYGGRAVVEGIDLVLGEGEFLGIVGPNGSGKSTVLRTFLGLLPPVAGELRRGPGFRAGYVPQTSSIDPLFPFGALDVVSMAALPERALPLLDARERRALATEALERVGMGPLAARPFRDLSGGERQRVLLARALASRPTVLALDEPTSGLDLAAEARLLALVRRLRTEDRMTVVMVSHGLGTVAAEASRVLLLREGRHRGGTVEEVVRADVLGDLYGVPIRVDEAGGRRFVTALPEDPA